MQWSGICLGTLAALSQHAQPVFLLSFEFYFLFPHPVARNLRNKCALFAPYELPPDQGWWLAASNALGSILLSPKRSLL